MLKAFWTWNPVCSGEFRRFDEPHMLRHNAWLFDKELWRRLFRSMALCGFNGMVLANTHPFPFMVRNDRFPEAALLDNPALERYQRAYHWIIREGLRHGIETYLLFFSIYYPEPMLEHLGVFDRGAYEASDLAIDYTRCCVEQTLTEYPELGGLIGDASENIHGSRGAFLRQAVAEPFESLANGKRLILRGWCSDFDEFRTEIVERVRVPITFSVKYTWEHLVHPNPDPLFMDWVRDAGAANVMAEFWISNVEPFTCFAYSTVRGIISNLSQIGCAGFSVHPLSVYEWPFTSDRCWKHQFDRDAPFYSAWGEGEMPQSPVRALLEDESVRPGLEAASGILMLAALYFGGDRQNQWRPQFCSVRHPDGIRLLTIGDMCALTQQQSRWGTGLWKAFDSLDWMTTLTGRPVMHFEDYDPDRSGVYGPIEFAEEMDLLASRAESAVNRAERRRRGTRTRCLLKHARAMALLGRFWAERARAAVAHVSGDQAEAIRHVENALEFFRETERLQASHANAFRAITGRCAQANNWDMPRAALEAELRDWRLGRLDGRYYSGVTEHRDTSTHPRGPWSPPRQ